MKPIIGIIICGITDNKQFVSEPYIECITRSGGIPVIIPCPFFHLEKLTSYYFADYFHTYFKMCDCFLFCGGGDIAPFLFNEPPLNNCGNTELKIDLFQISFMEYLLKHAKPILAICRGMQVMNVALGGTIYQDLSLRKEPSLCHMQNSSSRNTPSHLVSYHPDSKLHNIYGSYSYTNTFHHQAIHKIGTRINAVGHTEDGIIEAIEVSNHPFAIGIQWHPECMYNISSSSRNLFLKFIKSGA